MFTKILVPTDGSPHATRAAEYAADPRQAVSVLRLVSCPVLVVKG